MVISPPILELLNSIPSSATMSRTNELANFVPPYQKVMYSTPPIPPRGNNRCPLWDTPSSVVTFLFNWLVWPVGSVGLSSGDNLGQGYKATIWVMWFALEPSIRPL
jgi:hypothetical protein